MTFPGYDDGGTGAPVATAAVLTSTTPTERARLLVRGAYDLHVHVEPDVMRRRITDLQLARRCWDVGLAGFVLKSHYVPTAERAAVLNEALDGAVRVLGTLTLNAAVGGMNPLAVEIAAREGARIVWMPTVDAANHRDEARRPAAGRDAADVAGAAAGAGRPGHHGAPVPVLDAAGRPLPATRRCCGWPRGTSSSWPPGTCPPGRPGPSRRRRSRPGCGTS